MISRMRFDHTGLFWFGYHKENNEETCYCEHCEIL